MAKRTNRVPDHATAGAVAHATGNQTAINLHAWANQPGMPAAHSPEAHQERQATDRSVDARADPRVQRSRRPSRGDASAQVNSSA